MKTMPLSRRLSLTLALLLLLGFGASVAMQVRLAEEREQELVQRLSRSLAEHIVAHALPSDAAGGAAVKRLFQELMDVNPSVEVYLLDAEGRIVGEAAPPGHLRLDHVDLAPIQRLLAGDPLPILGDDPRHPGGHKVFSAARWPRAGAPAGTAAGFVYVILQGEDRDAVAGGLAPQRALEATSWTFGLVAAVTLLAGLAAFRWITRPLQRLAADVQAFAAERGDGQATSSPLAFPVDGDEIRGLQSTFEQLKHRINRQWQELAQQDQQRRDMIANISHDLRTPLTSLHGYLETLRWKDASLNIADRQRYLDVALAQSTKVGALAQQLFELARLECGAVRLESEYFALADLVQDVFQKFELAAEARGQRLLADIAPNLPGVRADLGLIERVLTNLLDNAIRHTPGGGVITVRLAREDDAVLVEVADTGPGIPAAQQSQLFLRPSLLHGGQAGHRGRESTVAGASVESGGLGLVIVQRILQLHGSEIRLVAAAGAGAVFRFVLAAGSATPATR